MKKSCGKNIGCLDKIFRVIVGLALLLAFNADVLQEPYSYMLAIMGLVSLFTAATGYCHLYTILKLNTCKIEK